MATENNNKTLNVPNLRFPEFSGEWTKTTLGKIGETFNGLTGKSGSDFGQGSPYITYKSIFDNSKIDLSRVEYVTITDAERKKQTQNEVQYGDIFFTTSSETPDEVGMTSVLLDEVKDCYLNSFCFGYRLNSITDVLPEYMRFYLRSNTIRRRLFVLAQGSTRFNISKGEVMGLTIKLPGTAEQRKIAQLLTMIEERIATQIKIIEKFESLIRGLITDVNSGRIAQCKSVYLRDLLIEQHEKNTNNYEVCSVSVSQGVINQIDYLGRSFAAKEVLHYSVVKCGDIVYTKSPTGEFPYGIVKRSDITKPVAVSPLYGVYRPINDYVGRYLHLYFKSPINAKNYLHKLIQKGAKNTINITNQHFLDNKILIPEKGWLDKIVKFAAAIEMKIATENKVLQTLQQQKDFLLSKMFI